MVVGAQAAREGQPVGGLPFVECEQAIDRTVVAARGGLLPLCAQDQGVARVNGQGALISEQGALTLGLEALLAVAEVLAVDLGAADEQEIVQAPIEEGCLQSELPRQFLGLADFIAVADVALGAEAERVEFGVGVVPQQAALEPGAPGEVQAAPSGDAQRFQAIVLGVAVAVIRAGDAVGVQPRGGQPEVAGGAALADRRAAANGAKRAGLGEQVAAKTGSRLPGCDGNDAADRVASPERRLRPAQNLDALDVLGVQPGKVEAPARRGCIVDGHAIDQHQRLVAGGASNPNERGTAEGAVLVDGDARRLGDGIQDMPEAERFDLRRIDDPHGRSVLRSGLLNARSGNHDGVDAILVFAAGRRLAGGGCGRRGDQKD